MILFTDFECKVSAFCAKRQIFGVYSPKHKHTLCEMEETDEFFFL